MRSTESMDPAVVFAAVADERRGIAHMIDQLTPAQLATPSLCNGWDVKTVAAHLVSVFADGFWVFQWTALRRGGINRAIDELASRRARLPASEIAATLRQRADHRLSPPLTGPLSGLTDVLVHGGDIRIPLGLDFDPHPKCVSSALDFLAGPRPLGFSSRSRLKGLRLYGSDIGRNWGSGAEVSGPANALMMAACGRTALLHQLDGPGLPVLRDRLGMGSSG
jgi:uncharacterized protein (TIGR03083 family)